MSGSSPSFVAPLALPSDAPAGSALADARSRVDALNTQARSLRWRDPAQAVTLSREAGAMALRLDYQHGLATSLLLAGRCAGPGLGLADTGAGLLRQALSLFEGLDDARGVGDALNALANHHAQRGEFAQALALYQRNLDLRRSAGDAAGEAGALNNLGIVLRQIGRYADALEHLQCSLDVATAAHDERARAWAHSNIGTVLADLGEPQLAQDHHQRAVALMRPLNLPAPLLQALLALADWLRRDGQLAPAWPLLAEARDLAGALGHPGLTARVLLALGRWRQDQAELEPAEHLLLEALNLARRSGQVALEAEVMLALGCHRSRLHEAEAAVRLLSQALQLAEGLGADLLCGQVHQALSALHEQTGNWREALHHYKAFDACRQRLLSQDNQRRIRQLMQRADLEQVRRSAEAERRRAEALGNALHAALAADRQKQELVERLERQSDLLRQLAREDGLTGLANRRWLDAQLVRERERARRYHHPLAVAMLDVDHFKRINDECSHPVGDEVLRRIGLLLRDACRSGDIVGRYGGEEFLVVLVETSLANATTVCEKLRQRVAALDLGGLHPALQRVTVSIGVAGDAADPVAQDLVQQADQALYQAKLTGRNRVCVAGAAGGTSA